MVSLQNFLQLEDFNGVPLAAGKIYVYHQGRTELAEIYSDINGETPIANPAVLDDLGMQEIYVSNVYNYTVVVTDPYNNELFTRDIYPNGVDGDGNNRLYEGIDPIVVNNDKMAISAKKATLSVQDPLYFVEDSQSAVCIGLQESAYSGLPYVENSAIGYGMAGNISSISGLGFYALSANSASLADSASIAASAENAGLVTDGWETGSDGRITAYNGTAFSAGKVYSGISPVYVDNENDKIGVSSKDFLANAPLYFTEYSNRVELSISGLPPTPGLMYESGFNYESGKITGYNGSGISAGKVYSGIDPVHVDNVNDTISLDSATLGVQAPLYFVEDSESATIIGLNSAQIQIDIPESANWEDAYSTVNNNSASWTSAANELAVLNTAKWEGASDTLSSHSADWDSTYTTVSNNSGTWSSEQIQVSGINIDIYETAGTVVFSGSTYTGNAQEALDEVYSNSANWNNKLDSSIYASDSGNFYTKDNPSGFITGVDLTPYQLTADMTGYLTTGDSSEFYPMTGNPSGFLTAGTDWTNTITAASAYAYSEATAQIPTDYATTAQLADKLDSAIYANDSGTFLTAHQSLPESADWNSAASTVSAGYANWDASYAILTANSGNWDSTYTTVSNNSGAWSSEQIQVSGINIDIYETAGMVVFSGMSGSEFPQSATDAINVVTGGSANWNSTYITVSNNSASWGGGSTYTGDAQGALDEVYSNSADWNSTTDTVSTNSGAWGGSGIEISAGFGINIQLIDNKLVFSLATATGDI